MSLVTCPHCRMFYTPRTYGTSHGCAAECRANPSGPDTTITIRGQDPSGVLCGWWDDDHEAGVAHFYCDDHQGGYVPVCVAGEEAERHTNRAVHLYRDWEPDGPPASVPYPNMGTTEGAPCSACARRIKAWPRVPFNLYACAKDPREEEE